MSFCSGIVQVPFIRARSVRLDGVPRFFFSASVRVIRSLETSKKNPVNQGFFMLNKVCKLAPQ